MYKYANQESEPMKQQTAFEWLMEQLNKGSYETADVLKLIDHAIMIERQQINNQDNQSSENGNSN